MFATEGSEFGMLETPLPNNNISLKKKIWVWLQLSFGRSYYFHFARQANLRP